MSPIFLSLSIQASNRDDSDTDEFKAVKPSFVAPSQPLEKSLKDHIHRSSAKSSGASAEMPGTPGSKTTGTSGKKTKKRRSKETSPVIASK